MSRPAGKVIAWHFEKEQQPSAYRTISTIVCFMDPTHILYSPGKGHTCLSMSSDTNAVIHSLMAIVCQTGQGKKKKTLEIMTSVQWPWSWRYLAIVGLRLMYTTRTTKTWYFFVIVIFVSWNVSLPRRTFSDMYSVIFHLCELSDKNASEQCPALHLVLYVLPFHYPLCFAQLKFPFYQPSLLSCVFHRSMYLLERKKISYEHAHIQC